MVGAISTSRSQTGRFLRSVRDFKIHVDRDRRGPAVQAGPSPCDSRGIATWAGHSQASRTRRHAGLDREEA
jgi:hypothetical protein